MKDSKTSQGAKIVTKKTHIVKAKPAPTKGPNNGPGNGCRPTGQI